MIEAILSIVSLILGLFKPKSDVQAAHDSGVNEGVGQQKSTDQAAVIKDVKDAKDATDSVERDVVSGRVPITESDGFRRD